MAVRNSKYHCDPYLLSNRYKAYRSDLGQLGGPSLALKARSGGRSPCGRLSALDDTCVTRICVQHRFSVNKLPCDLDEFTLIPFGDAIFSLKVKGLLINNVQ